MIVVRFQGAAA